ncbi:putative nucleolin [Monocercomonoides exilis]|uniref:putative nucleolin n=1 Tax=Monocercomonoides exilis TaxID=2049356 RepID=UPI00355A4498|nr:putative nucleolin [Monocercomonoides exilis]|eukprot:MONOS_2377.1-p1 / transcript=MONOS_2377.1 / gene=MONOS_2377 / organism=Monocercomonoides_exilis_PA203 / gene_product=unspecified product / transcript_product=unspecified product / location=Mono_scaffold00049:11533-12955(-) / protein_length=449 / sequence_SO=supercontig / SO=protein_coding / is_pseudo=false
MTFQPQMGDFPVDFNLDDVPKQTETFDVFVKGLNDEVSITDWKKYFGQFGEVSYIQITKNDQGVCKGFGFVRMFREEEALRLVEQVNGKAPFGRQLVASMSTKYKQSRGLPLDNPAQTPKQTTTHTNDGFTLFIHNLPKEFTNGELREIFQQYGYITKANIPTNKETGEPLNYGFVTFQDYDSARAAVAGMDKKRIRDRELKVSFRTAPKGRSGAMKSTPVYSMGQQYDPLRYNPNPAHQAPFTHQPLGYGVERAQWQYSDHPPMYPPRGSTQPVSAPTDASYGSSYAYPPPGGYPPSTAYPPPSYPPATAPTGYLPQYSDPQAQPQPAPQQTGAPGIPSQPGPYSQSSGAPPSAYPPPATTTSYPPQYPESQPSMPVTTPSYPQSAQSTSALLPSPATSSAYPPPPSASSATSSYTQPQATNMYPQTSGAPSTSQAYPPQHARGEYLY